MLIGVNSRIYQEENTGIPNFIENLYSNILKLDKSNKYLFFQTSAKKRLGLTRFFPLQSGNVQAFLFDNFFSNKIIKQEKINIFHGPAHILPFFKIKKVKYVLTVHDLAFLAVPKYYPFFFSQYYKYFMQRSLNNADIIIADSRNTKKDIIKFYGIDPQKIKVIYLGVDNFYLNSGRASERLIKNKYIFSITTHPKRKNTISLINIFAKKAKLSTYKLLIAGQLSKDQQLRLQQLINRLGLENQIILFGFASRSQLKNLYQNAEFFIYPSVYEGFGLPVLEAMACRCPVITSSNSCLPELTADTQWLVNPYNSDDIASKMLRMLVLSNYERKRMVDKAYYRAKKFTWKKTAEAYIKIFNDLI